MSQPATRSKSIDQLVKLLQFMRRGVPYDLAAYTLMSAARDLAATCAATQTITLEGRGDTSVYSFEHCLPEGYEVHSVVSVNYCGCLDPIDRCNPCPHGWELLEPTCIEILPCPSGPFTLRVVLTPTGDCRSLLDVFMRHKDYLVAKANGQLASMEGEEWASSSVARKELHEAQGRLKSISAKEARGSSHKSPKQFVQVI